MFTPAASDVVACGRGPDTLTGIVHEPCSVSDTRGVRGDAFWREAKYANLIIAVVAKSRGGQGRPRLEDFLDTPAVDRTGASTTATTTTAGLCRAAVLGFGNLPPSYSADDDGNNHPQDDEPNEYGGSLPTAAAAPRTPRGTLLLRMRRKLGGRWSSHLQRLCADRFWHPSFVSPRLTSKTWAFAKSAAVHGASFCATCRSWTPLGPQD